MANGTYFHDGEGWKPTNSRPPLRRPVANSGNYPDWSRFKWYVLGDSLTDPAGGVHTDKFYYQYISERTGIQAIVDGLGGTGYYAGVSSNKHFVERVKNIPEDVDIVTIFGSGNDVTHGYDNYKQAIADTLKEFFENRPGLPVIVVPPSPWASYPKRGDEWKNYCDALELCAMAYDCHYVGEMWTAPPFNPHSLADRNAFFTKCENGVHPDENGHRLLAPYFYDAMAKVLALEGKCWAGGGGNVGLDTTLTQSGKAADAKAVGDALTELEAKIHEGGGTGENVPQDYYLLKSPSGTAYKVTVTDGGALQVVGVADSSPDDLIPGRLLIWSDDFDGDSIDPEKWMFRLDNEKYYGAEDVQVSDSILTYPITYDAANDRWRNFYMMTSGLEDVKYGRVEARMKWDLGAYTAWWTVGHVQEKYKGSTRGIIWPRSGEIDIFEDSCDGKLDVGLHWGEVEDAGLNQNNDIRRVGEEIDVTQWHNYAMEWDESSIVIYVDNVEMTRYDISNIVYEDGTRPFNLPHYFIISAWCKNPESGKDYYCYVDWVRYYAPAGITAEIPIQSMSLEQTAVALNKNRVRELALTISPDYCTDYTMRWDSSDRSIATFDGGRVKALSNGVCELTVTTKNGVVARCDLTVSDSVLNNASDIVLEYGEKDTYYAGDIITITPVVTPKWATYLDCNWTSSNESVATVANGVVTFVGGGEVTITATAKDNSGISRTAVFTSIAVIPDSIPTDGCVAKYTRKGWSAGGTWPSDLESGTALDTDKYTQGEGYWYQSFLSTANAYTAIDLDTSGAFTIAERVLAKTGMSLAGYVWHIADSQSNGKTNPVMNAALNSDGKYIVRYTNASGSKIVDNATVYQPLLDNIAEKLVVDDMPINLVFTHAADGTWATYANGTLVANGMDGVAAETIPNAVLCLGAFPGVNRQKGEAFKFQALLAYNKAMSAGEVTALNAALDAMYK